MVQCSDITMMQGGGSEKVTTTILFLNVYIKAFWQNLIADGYTKVEYVDPKVEAIDDTSAVLTSGWRMNKASGVIHKELWVIQEDGSAKLREDDFEAMG